MVEAATIAKVLGRSRMFQGVAEQELTHIAAMVRARHLDGGDVLFREGAPGDSMALVVRGSVSVRSERPGELTEVTVIGAGEVVGELACLDPAPRSATVRAVEGTWIVEIDRTVLLAMQRSLPAAALAMTREVIRTVTTRIRETNTLVDRLWRLWSHTPDDAPAPAPPPAGEHAPAAVDLRRLPTFAAYSDRELSALVAVAPPRRYPAGHELCREGGPGTSCFILVWGTVHVTKRVSAVPRLLGVLGPGAMVGQMALVDAHRRSATVAAADEVIALELRRDDFDRLVAAASPLAVRFQEQIAIAGIRQLRTASARLVSVRHAAEQAAARRDEPHELGLAYMNTALREWGMEIGDLDAITVVRPEGIMTRAEIEARLRR